MRKCFLGFVSGPLCLLGCSVAAEKFEIEAKDRAQIASTIEAIGVFADFREFEAICQLYAPVSTSDYSSLWGNAPRSGSPSDKATGWSGFLPGFDVTRHDITVGEMKVSKNSANAIAQVEADHWLGSERWQLSGRYHVKLRKKENRWVISDWTFELESETGDRELVDRAEQIAVDRVSRPIACPE